MYDDFWRRTSNRDRFEQMRAPALNIAGWYDAYAGAAFVNHVGLVTRGGSEEARTGSRLVMGPWHHHIATERVVGDVDFGPDAILDLHALQRRFLGRWVSGRDA